MHRTQERPFCCVPKPLRSGERVRTCSLHGIALLVTDQGRVQARGKGNENLFVDDHTCRAKRKVPRLVLIGTKERTLRDVVAYAFRVDQWEKL